MGSIGRAGAQRGFCLCSSAATKYPIGGWQTVNQGSGAGVFANLARGYEEVRRAFEIIGNGLASYSYRPWLARSARQAPLFRPQA